MTTDRMSPFASTSATVGGSSLVHERQAVPAATVADTAGHVTARANEDYFGDIEEARFGRADLPRLDTVAHISSRRSLAGDGR